MDGTHMEFFWTGYTEVLKTVLSWPPIVLIILLVAVLKFQDEIRGILKSKIEARVGNASITVYQDQGANLEIAQKESATASTAPVGANDVVPVEIYKSLLERYKWERIFNSIFGTQIDLLFLLANNNNQPISLPQTYKFYTDHQNRAKVTTYPLSDYLNFMIQFDLIAAHTNENHASYTITKFGMNFLSYIMENYKHNWNSRPF